MKKWIVTNWEEIVVCVVVIVLLIVTLSITGCCSAKCTKTVYEPVEVQVPVPVPSPDLPIPDLPDCGTAPEGWREAALWVKDCFDTLFLKIEEYNHVLTAHNEANDTPSQ